VTPELHAQLTTRCRGRCECQCGARVPPGEIDHFFSRSKAAEGTDTCWVLSVRCHYEKTRNHPTSSEWLRRFIEHCKRHGYTESQQRAEARLQFVDTRRQLGAALGARR
jgi:hypothetical protein